MLFPWSNDMLINLKESRLFVVWTTLMKRNIYQLHRKKSERKPKDKQYSVPLFVTAYNTVTLTCFS